MADRGSNAARVSRRSMAGVGTSERWKVGKFSTPPGFSTC